MLRPAPLLLCVFLVGCPKKAPVQPPILAPQDLTPEVLNQWVAEVCELIEEESGGTFTKTPHVRLATPTELTQVVIDEAAKMDHMQHPDIPERVWRERYAGMPVSGVLGKYGIFTDVMYVDADVIFGMSEEKHWGPEGVERIGKVLLAHELTHALQAQYGDASDRWDELPDSDAFEAFRSVTEGQASWVERRVGARIGADDAVQLMIEMQGWSFEEGPEHPAAFRIWSAYGQGDVWMQSLYDEGGFERQWLAVREPPTRSAVVFGTEPYSADYRPPPEAWKGQFAGLERKLGQGVWMTTESRVGEVDMRQLLFGYGDVALPHIHAIEEAWQQTSSLADREVLFQRFRFGTEEQASAYMDLMLGEPAHQPDEEAVPLDFGDQAVKITAAPGVSKGQGSLSKNEARTWLVRHGREIVALRCLYFRPGLRADEVLRAMLERLEAE